MQKTLSIIKPDAVKRNILGQVITKIEQAKLKIIAQKMLILTAEQARSFYFIHKEQVFFDNLVKYMISGPIVAQVLKGENAIYQYRELMGATDPKNAKKGTIRADFGLNIEENVVHGSDSAQNADFEISFFFSHLNIMIN